MEIEYGQFMRQIRLSEDVDPEQATARYEHGVVTVTLDVRLYLRRRTLRALNRKRTPDERIRYQSKNDMVRAMCRRDVSCFVRVSDSARSSAFSMATPA